MSFPLPTPYPYQQTYYINTGIPEGEFQHPPIVTSMKNLPTLESYGELYGCKSCDGGFISSRTTGKIDLSFNNPHDLTAEYDCACNTLNPLYDYYSYGRATAISEAGITLKSEGIRYSTQQKIQGSVRVASSLYTMSLGGLTAYKNRGPIPWNQMSDRPVPSVQKAYIPSGTGALSYNKTVTRNRPGAMSPGGVGVDIKHNSYERYLNRLKGKAPLRTQRTTPQFISDTPLPNMYGAKSFTIGIIPSCKCN